MEGLDVLGAVDFDDYLVGAAVPDPSPVLSKLSKAASRANAAAGKLGKAGKRAARAAQRLRQHATTAVTKGQKLKSAIDKAKTKAAATVAAKPAAVKAAAKAAMTPASSALTAARAGTPARPTARATPPASAAAKSSRMMPVHVLGLNPALLASLTDWIQPMLDVYSAFAAQIDDASAAAEVIAMVGPLLDQLTSLNPSSPLIASGNNIVASANSIIDNVPYPADPSTTNVGWWVGDISDTGAQLQAQAIDWIKAARDAIATGGGAAAPGAPGTTPTSPTAVAKISLTPISEMTIPNQPVQFFARITNAAGQVVTPLSPATWALSPMTGATIDQAGNFTAQTPGTYTITVTADGVTAQATSMVQGGQDAGSGGGGGGSGGGGGGGDSGGDQGGDNGGGDQGDAGLPDQGTDQYAQDDGDQYPPEGGGTTFDALSAYVQRGREQRAAAYGGASDDSDDSASADDSGDQSDPFADQGDDSGYPGDDQSDPFAEVGGGGGHGGGGHGGGHGGFGGRRGMRGGGWGPWYGGPWYDGYGYDVLLEDDESLADQIAKKVAQKQWAAGSHVGYVAPETHWYTVATPSAVKDEMDKIMREGNTLDQDINATNTGDPSYPAFKNAWLAFWLSYKKFYDDNATGISGWTSRLWSSTGDQIVGYGNQLNDWRTRLRQFAGARVTEPTVTAMIRREDPSATNWKPYVIGFGVLAGVGVLGFGIAKVVAAAKVAHRLTRR